MLSLAIYKYLNLCTVYKKDNLFQFRAVEVSVVIRLSICITETGKCDVDTALR